MIPRYITKDLVSALNRQVAVVLVGPRQVGKTTLALEVSNSYDALYLDLEDMNDRVKLSDPTSFLESYEDKLVVLDEIHRTPEIFSSLRGIIDRGRRRGKRYGRFLILGSASIELLRQSGESLAGRVAYVFLSPLSALEVEGSTKARDMLWLRGGFPDSYLAKNDVTSFSLRRDFIKTYLERDVALFGPRIPSALLERLWIMLAHNQGNILNASELARALETSTQSVSRYIDLLVDLLLVRRLVPYRSNIGKRMVKSPKVYVRDSGLVHALLNIIELDQLYGHPVIGRSWEGWVIETLLSVLPWGASAFYYRTRAGAEVDLVIEFSDRTIWAIEIKRSMSSKPSRGYYAACDDIKPNRCLIVHAGDEQFPISRNVTAIGIRQLAEEIADSQLL